MARSCVKCGCTLGKNAPSNYCPECSVRLGLMDPFTAGIVVTPNAADYYRKQREEPIFDIWKHIHSAPRPWRRRGGRPGAFLSARNDALANLAIIGAGLATAATLSAWPDVVVGLGIFLLNLDAAREVLEAARAERRTAAALAEP